MSSHRKYFRRSSSAGRRLRVESLEPRNLLAALNVGDITWGSIDSNDEVDSYTFSGGAGNVIDLVLTSTPTNGPFETYAELYAPSNNLHTYFYFSNGAQRITLPFEDGEYTLKISDAGQDATGGYSIGMEQISPISPNPTSLLFGDITAGAINNPIEKDQFTFDAEALATIDLALTSQPTSGGFEPMAELFAPSGNRVTYWYLSNGPQRITLPEETGTYMLQIADAGLAATGKYTIGYEGIHQISPNPVSLVMGGITAGTTWRAIEKDQFVFNADGPTTIDLVVSSAAKSGDFEALAELFAPSGNRVTYWYTSNGSQRITLPDEQGQYMLMISDSGLDATGNYSIGFEGLNPFSPAPVAVVKGGITKGFTRTIEKDQLQFYSPGSAIIDLVVSSTPTQGDYEALVELFAPSGNRVTYFYTSNGNQRIQLPDETGNYILMISDAGLDGAGFYQLGFEGINPISPSPRTLVRNATTTGQISSALEKDQFVFRAVNNETIKLQLSEVAIDANFDALAELFSPSGERVTYFYTSNGQQTIDLTGHGTGNYLLQIRSDNLTSRGDYAVGFIGNPLPAVIAAPNSLHAVTTYSTKVDLAWNGPSTNEVGFQIAVSFDGGESFVTVGTTTINDHDFTVTGLIPGQSYKMKVRAFNDNDVSLYSNVIDVTTRLSTPTNLRRGTLTATSVQLLWDDKSNNEGRFEIFRRIGNTGDFVKVATVGANLQSYVVTGLTKNTLYQFRVRAANYKTTSFFSNTLSVTTPSA